MKSIIIGMLLLLFVMCGFASAAAPIGPTEPIAPKGTWNLGVGYFYEDSKYEIDDENFRTRSDQVYGEASGTPIENVELYGRLGVANLKAKDTDVHFKVSGPNPFGTLGAKWMFYNGGAFGLGTFAQGTYHFSKYEDGDTKIEDLYNIQAGLTGQVKLYQNIALYGGAFWHYAHGKAVITDLGVRSSETMRENSWIGGVLGFRIPFSKNFGLNLEGQYINNLSGGAYLNYTF
jgi:hypothetical protein